MIQSNSELILLEPAAEPVSIGSRFQAAFDLAASIAAQYGISALSGLLASTGASLQTEEITVAVLGRFKAGKSSFLNDLIFRAAHSSDGAGPLPVGVVPVTAVVTEIRFGGRERVIVRFLEGGEREIPLGEISSYISERDNPENRRRVQSITVETPQLSCFRGLKFVDTPGLESALAHNTRTSLDWLPNVGLALVAVSVDPPLSERDIDLIRALYQYTPKVAILLTKTDLLNDQELTEVVEFIGAQLAKVFREAPHIFPYSTKPGFGRFRAAFEAALVKNALGHFGDARQAILLRKLETLLRETTDYLTLSLKSAETVQSERQELKARAIGEKEVLDEVKSQIRLVIQNAAAGTRTAVSERLESHQSEVEQALLARFETEFPEWTTSLAALLSAFEDWLAASLRDQLAAISIREASQFLAPLDKVQKQILRTLQHFRDRLSDRTEQAFGVPLRTTETEIEVSEPSAPDIRVGRVFDRNWELLSPILPVWLIRGMVRRHFERKIPYVVYQNLSRLSTQWEASIHGVMRQVEKEAKQRLDELIRTVERLLETGDGQAPKIRAGLERLQRAHRSLVER